MKNFLIFVIFLFNFVLSNLVFATTLSIYEAPVSTSKVTDSVKNGDQLIPFFCNEKKDWTKVANPETGDVGWVETKNLKGSTIITEINGNRTQRIILNDKDQPASYQVIQYSSSQELKPEEIEKTIKEIEQRNEKMRASMKKMHEEMQMMFEDFNKDFPTFPSLKHKKGKAKK